MRWRQIGVLDTMDDPVLPFFVAWESPASDHPSAGGSSVALASLEMCGDPASVSALPGVTEDLVAIQWVDDDTPGITAIWFDTAHGRVRID